MLNGITTRSPGLICVTSEPTSSTMPIGSCPRMSPSSMYGPSTSYRCRSEPQMPDEVTRMIASVGFSIAGSSTLSTRTSWFPCQATAFMRGFLSSGGGGRSPADHAAPAAEATHEQEDRADHQDQHQQAAWRREEQMQQVAERQRPDDRAEDAAPAAAATRATAEAAVARAEASAAEAADPDARERAVGSGQRYGVAR